MRMVAELVGMKIVYMTRDDIRLKTQMAQG